MKKNCPGFTLIELMMVFSITTILFGFGISAYTNFNRRQLVDQVAMELKSNLRLVQNKASSGEKDCAGTLDGYLVTFTADGYTYHSQCGTSLGVVKQVTLPASVRITTFPTGNEIFFKVLGQGTDINDQEVIIFMGFGNYTSNITVSRTGDIR